MQIPCFLFELAKISPQKIYLVGGAIRDLLMGYELLDYDLLCTKNAIELAKWLQNENIASIQSIHEAFGTAKVYLKQNNIFLDLATARSEVYAGPGVLPKVNLCVPLEEDLKRRDFTINAIAFELAENIFVDPFKGCQDLEKKIIQVMHVKSYYEDPTRIIRAARFANRFDFKIAQTDLEQIEKALQSDCLLGLINRIRGARVGIELKRLLQNANWLQASELLWQIGGWNLCKTGLNTSQEKPRFELNCWEARLAWVLQKESDLPQLMLKLEIQAQAQRQINYIFNLIQNNYPKPSLKLFHEINKLEKDYKNLLFSLSPEFYKLFEKMEKARPDILLGK
jgi:tRNA nucleotidyltransferase/poly(A) polymerase